MHPIESREDQAIHVVAGEPIALPAKFQELRPHQITAIEQIIELYRQGHRVVMLDAPTGAGKTVIGEAVRQVRNRGQRSLYICTTKSLQDQFLLDFPAARVIKGRDNYATLDHPERFYEQGVRRLSAAHCDKVGLEVGQTGLHDTCDTCAVGGLADNGDTNLPIPLHCFNCHPWQDCPYERAKSDALAGPLSVANTAYFLAEAQFVGRFSGNFSFTVVDEADTLESVLMGNIEVTLSSRLIRALKMKPIPRGSWTSDNAWEVWVEWLGEAFQRANAEVSRLLREIQPYRDNQEPPPRQLRSELDTWSSRAVQLQRVRANILTDPHNWVLDGYQQGHVIFRPVTVAPYAYRYLWQHLGTHRADQDTQGNPPLPSEALLMSATLISDAQMADDLGLDDWATVRVDSHFPIERRRLHYFGRASMSNKNKDTAWPEMAEALAQVLRDHPHESVLVHTVSYKLTEHLHQALTPEFGTRLVTYYEASHRDKALTQFQVGESKVLLAPSFDRGIDLSDDECRVIVICKVPFPNLGDKQISKRFYGTGASGRTWYGTQTVRSLVQMTGRGMRHKDDWVITYILDRQFQTNVWRNYRNLIPKWWKDALQWHV